MTVSAGLVTPLVLGWLRIGGLGSLTDWALYAIGYHEEQHFNGFMLGNKIWVRSLPWWWAFFVVKWLTGWGSLVVVG